MIMMMRKKKRRKVEWEMVQKWEVVSQVSCNVFVSLIVRCIIREKNFVCSWLHLGVTGWERRGRVLRIDVCSSLSASDCDAGKGTSGPIRHLQRFSLRSPNGTCWEPGRNSNSWMPPFAGASEFVKLIRY